MQDINKKKTVLDNNANIYQTREQKSEKQKFKEMSFKEKLAHFRSYYALKLVISLLILAGVISLIYNMVTPKVEDALYAIVLNYSINDEKVQIMENEFSDILEIDEMEQVRIDNSFYFGEDSFDASSSAANQMKLTTYLAAKEIDIIIAPESLFKDYIQNGFFDNLEGQLPTDLFSKLTDHLHFGKTEEDSTDIAYGIVLDDLPLYENMNLQESQMIGIVVNSEKKENGIKFIRYLFNMN